MDIRPFDYTKADYERYVTLRNSIVTDQPASVEFEQRFDQEWPSDLLHERLILEDGDGRTLAVAEYNNLVWSDQPHKYGFMIFVRPDARRQGLGTRLYRRILKALTPYNPSGFETKTREDWPDGIDYLQKRGFELVSRQQQSALELDRFDAGDFADAMRSAAASGLEITTLGEYLRVEPDALRKLYDLEMDVMRDVPWYDEMAARPFEFWVKSYKDNPDLLPSGYIVALDGREVAGMSQLWASQATDRILYTGFTGVRRPYRRLGLATTMKVRAIQYAKTLAASDGRPPRIVTDNEESNPMLQINLRLGFQETPAWLIYFR